VLSILAIFCMFRFLGWISEHIPLLSVLPWATSTSRGSETEPRESLPNFPTPITLTDKRGHSKWTVSIPPNRAFPLTINEYASIGAKCGEISDKTNQEQSQDHGHSLQFVDIQEAQNNGFLPKPRAAMKEAVDRDIPPCAKSLTVVLESTDAGIGNTLMMLWTAYGLAQKEGRSFFLDDTRWAYGKYSDIFQPPPSPKCSPPPDNEKIPCPRQARHLVVTTTTFSDVFRDLTSRHTDDEGPVPLSTRKSAFALARQGHDALFRLNNDDGRYVDSRVRDLLSKRIVPKTKGKQNGVVIGLHIRRGDRHPFEYQYRDSYIPLDKYTDVARKLIEDRVGLSGPLSSTSDKEEITAKEHSFFVVSSDDPMVYESGEVVGGKEAREGTMYPAQDRIRLASKQAIQDANPPDKHVMHKFVDEAFGWEGGFFSAMFWNLGMGSAAKANANTNAVSMARAGARGGTTTPESEIGMAPLASAETIRLRSLVGRAYMMDLAVVADVSDVVVCAVSAVGCRILAVMQGWESAVERENWVNVDGGFGWLGVSE